MVVMGHVLTMCIRDIDQAIVFKIIGKIHMPLFFFISGYFSYKITPEGKTFAAPKLWMRFKQLIIPFFVVSGIWVIYFPLSGLESPLNSTFQSLYFDSFKNGYWFTLTLFELILCYSAITFIFRRTKKFWQEILITLLAWSTIYLLNTALLPEKIVSLYGGCLLNAYLPIFMIGVLAKKYHSNFDKITENSSIYTICLLLGSVLLYLLIFPWEFQFMAITTVNLTIQSIFYICLTIVSISVVKPWVNNEFSSGNKPSMIVCCWEYLGKESLSIYLLHYFFLFPLTFLQEPLRNMALGFVPTFTVAALVATIIIAITLLVNYIIQRSPLLGLLLTGKINRK